MHQSRTTLALLCITALSISLVACAPESGPSNSDPKETQVAASGEAAASQTWAFHSSDGIISADLEEGTIEQVSSVPVEDPLEISADNQHQVGEHSYDDVSFPVYALGGGTGFVFDVTELPGFSRDWLIDKVFFNPAKPRLLQIVLKKSGEVKMWTFDALEDSIEDAEMVQEFADTDYVVNRTNGMLEERPEYVPTATELDESLVSAAVDHGFVRDTTELTATEIREQFPQLAASGVDETGSYFTYAAKLRLAEEDRLNAYAFGMPGVERWSSFVTPDGTEWQFDAGDTSLVTYTRSSPTDEWAKYGKTLSIAGFDDCCGMPKPSL